MTKLKKALAIGLATIIAITVVLGSVSLVGIYMFSGGF